MKNLLIFPILILTISIGYGQWTTTNLSEPKEAMGAAALPGSNVFWFAGGYADYETDKVEIYNAEAGTWTYDALSQARSWPAGLAYNGHIFFAGGMFWDSGQAASRVDIWSNEAAQWTQAELSVPRFSVSAVGIGNKAMFAGGVNLIPGNVYGRVDIYDFTTGQWTITDLAGPRAAMGSAVVETPTGPIALFGGGVTGLFGPATDLVEIYHANTGAWSTAQLSQARAHLSAAAVGHKVIFAGGITNDNEVSDRVDIYDALTGEWTTDSLSAPRCTDAVDGITKTVCGKVYIVGGGRTDLFSGVITDASNVIDIYDPATDTWSVEYLSKPVFIHSVVSDGKQLLVAGGRNTEFNYVYDDVDIYTCLTPASERKFRQTTIRVYPNPGNGHFYLENLSQQPLQSQALVQVFTLQGQMLQQQTLPPGEGQLQLTLPSGAYLLRVTSDSHSHAEIIHVQH